MKGRDNKKANTNLKTAQDFFKKKKQNESGKKTNQDEMDSAISFFKNDILQIDAYTTDIKHIISEFEGAKENSKGFNTRLAKLKENLLKDTKEELTENWKHSLKDNELLKDYNCESKDSLLHSLAYENMTLKLLLSKLDDICFLINLKTFNIQGSFNKNYKETVSQIANIKYLCEGFSEGNINVFDQSLSSAQGGGTFGSGARMNLSGPIIPQGGSGSATATLTKSISDEKNALEGTFSMSGQDMISLAKDIPHDIVEETITKISEMHKFGDFLGFDYDQDECFKVIFDRIRELFFSYNSKVFAPLIDFVNNGLKVKSALSQKVDLVFKNEVNDCFENVVLMRKVLEDSFAELKKNIKSLEKELELKKIEIVKKDEEFLKQKKKLEEIGNRDYSKYYFEMKKTNEEYLKAFENEVRQRNTKLFEEMEKQVDKNKQLKKEVKQLQSEIFGLKIKADNYNKLKDKVDEDYCEALKEQFEDAKEGFQDEIAKITDEYYKKRRALQDKNSKLEEENRKLKGMQNAIQKKLDAMENLFSK